MRILLSIILVTSFLSVQSQDNATAKFNGKFSMDALMGPYLLLDDVPYQSVLMKGTRVGYQTKSNLGFNIEYLIGNQRDKTDLIGTTHSASAMLQYFVTKENTRFRPYGYIGGGFFEFKDFSSDTWGASYFVGGGSELRISKIVRGTVECRYFNIGNLDLGGSNQLAVLWGVKALF